MADCAAHGAEGGDVNILVRRVYLVTAVDALCCRGGLGEGCVSHFFDCVFWELEVTLGMFSSGKRH